MKTLANPRFSAGQSFSHIFGCGALAILVFACSSSTGFAQAADPSDTDRDLLEQLDDADDESIELRDTGRPESEPAADKATTTRDDHDSIDQELLEELEAGEDIPLGDELERVPHDLGEDVDPLTRIGEKMRVVERLLEAKKIEAKTSDLQDEIVRDIEELIKQLQKQQQQQQSAQGGQQSRSQQQAQRSKVNLPNRQPKPQSGQRDSEKPATDSEDRAGKTEKIKVDMSELTEVIKEIWGHLPEKDRERLRQMSAEEIMPDHELAIEKYFRRLSQDDDE